jgi:hypothetical protein
MSPTYTDYHGSAPLPRQLLAYRDASPGRRSPTPLDADKRKLWLVEDTAGVLMLFRFSFSFSFSFFSLFSFPLSWFKWDCLEAEAKEKFEIKNENKSAKSKKKGASM